MLGDFSTEVCRDLDAALDYNTVSYDYFNGFSHRWIHILGWCVHPTSQGGHDQAESE